MFGFLSFLSSGAKAISGVTDAISTITSKIADAKIATIHAKTEDERIAANERVRTLEMQRDVLVKSLETRSNVLIAEAEQSKANIYMRTGIALPIAILLWKIFVWDKALGQWTSGRTDALSPELWNVITAVLAFYFLYEGAVGVTKLIRRP